MSDMMTFPDTWEEYERSYGFYDTEEVYTNGSRLIPSFRVRQWLDHESERKKKKMTLDEAIRHCEETSKFKSEEGQEARLQEQDKYADECFKCAEEHRQLAEWLRELRRYKALFGSPEEAARCLNGYMV